MKNLPEVLGLVAISMVLNGHAQQQHPESAIIVPLEQVEPSVPEHFRVWNHSGGSCYLVSAQVAMYCQELVDLADKWRHMYAGGEYTDRLISRLNAQGLDVAYTTNGDVEFLRWASRTRRIVALPYYPSHAVNGLGFYNGYYYLLDNNRINTIIKIPEETFIRLWREQYGGDAVTLVYSPLAPDPKP